MFIITMEEPKIAEINEIVLEALMIFTKTKIGVKFLF